MTKFVKKLMGLVIGLSLVAGVGIGAATLGNDGLETNASTVSDFDLVTLANIKSGSQYLLIGNGVALPCNPTVDSGKITGTALASVPKAGTGFLWTFTSTASGGNWTISDGSKYIYHTNGGNSTTNLAYGTSTLYPWNITSDTNGLIFAGVNNGTVKTRGMLLNGTKFGGYALSNKDTEGYYRVNVYKVKSGGAKYALSYDNNGGEGTISSIEYEADETVTLSDGKAFSRSGYILDGWATTASGDKAYDLGGSFSMPASATTLYAHWSTAYSLSFDNNGGSGTIASTNHIAGESITLPNGSAFSKTSCVLDGWATTAGGDKAYDLGGSFTMPAANTTLYAHWLEGKTITYNSNGGTGTISSISKLPGETVTLSNGKAFSRNGYILDGWATSASGDKVYSLSEEITMPSANLDLYAHWLPGYKWSDVTQTHNYGLPTTASTTETTINDPENAIELKINNVQANGSALYPGYVFVKAGGYMYNTTALDGYITSMKVTFTSGVSTSAKVKIGIGTAAGHDLAVKSSEVTCSASGVVEITALSSDGCSYFSIDETSDSKNAQLDRIEIIVSQTSTQELTKWSKEFYSSLKSGDSPICKGQGSTVTADLKTAWDAKAAVFANLSSDAKELAKNGSAVESGTDIEKALYLYDYCASHYADTICSRFITGRAVSSLVGQNRFINLNSDYSIGIILVIAFISVSSITAFILVKKYKRRHE